MRFSLHVSFMCVVTLHDPHLDVNTNFGKFWAIIYLSIDLVPFSLFFSCRTQILYIITFPQGFMDLFSCSFLYFQHFLNDILCITLDISIQASSNVLFNLSTEFLIWVIVVSSFRISVYFLKYISLVWSNSLTSHFFSEYCNQSLKSLVDLFLLFALFPIDTTFWYVWWFQLHVGHCGCAIVKALGGTVAFSEDFLFSMPCSRRQIISDHLGQAALRMNHIAVRLSPPFAQLYSHGLILSVSQLTGCGISQHSFPWQVFRSNFCLSSTCDPVPYSVASQPSALDTS